MIENNDESEKKSEETKRLEEGIKRRKEENKRLEEEMKRFEADKNSMNRILDKQKGFEQNNIELLEDFIKFSLNNRNNLTLYKHFVAFCAKKYGIDIDIAFVHTDVEDIAKIECKNYNDIPELTFEEFSKNKLPDTMFIDELQHKSGNTNIDNEPFEFKQLVSKVSEVPRGLIICALDRKNNIIHASGNIIINKKDNNNANIENIVLNDGNGCDAQKVFGNILKSRILPPCNNQPNHKTTNEEEKLIKQACELSNEFIKNYSIKSSKNFNQLVDACYVLSLLFCVEWLKIFKNDKKFFYNWILSKNELDLPPSVLRYSQNLNHMNIVEDTDNLTTSQHKAYGVRCVKLRTAYAQGGIDKMFLNSINILSIKKFDKILNEMEKDNKYKDIIEHAKKIQRKSDNYHNLITKVAEGTLTAKDREVFDSELDLKTELEKFNLYNKFNPYNRNIIKIERKSWWDKALSFGEENAKNRRINQLAKIMNNEFTRNMTPEEKREFKQKPKTERKMRPITFDDLLNISNIKKRCRCTSEPQVVE